MSGLHVVFGAGGGAGSALVRVLAERGERVRAVSRSGVSDLPRGVDDFRADARERTTALRAGEGAAVIYHCINVPYAEWEAKLPVIAQNLLDAAAATGARLVYCDNLYMYGQVDGPMTEETPAGAAGRKGRLRQRLATTLLDAHRQGRVPVAIGRASDFFGPGATNTIAGQLVFPAVVAGKRAHWIGSLDQPHSLNYIDDVARALIVLGTDDRALGEVWHLPPLPAITGRQFIEAVFDVAEREPRLGVYSRWMIRLVGSFDRQMREALEVLYQFEQPFVLDARRFLETFGFETTPLQQAIQATLSWEAARRRGR